MKHEINNVLKEIELQYNVTILYAAESGSRAWGFHSEDSDYDVRFIYRQDTMEYLKLYPRKDTIEKVEGALDIVGWDLKKTLQLAMKTNPSLVEWLNSPIEYQDNNAFGLKLLRLISANPNLKGMYHAYRSLCKSTFLGELKGEELRIKKFFYCLRPMAACHWIKTMDGIPSVKMEWLLHLDPFPREINQAYEELVHLKKDTEQKTVLKSEWLDVYNYIEKFLTEDVFYDKINNEIEKDEFDAFFLREINYA